MRTFVSSIAVAAIALAFTLCTAFGQSRTFVSHNGVDSGACGDENAPCLTFIQALANTLPGRVISCLDSGLFGVIPITITQSVTIDCRGQVGAIEILGSLNAITINGANIVVTLRGLSINGNGGSGAGVNIQAAAAVTIEDCLIENFTGGAGIIATNSASLQLNIADTLITNNSSGGGLPNQTGGIILLPGGSGTTGFAFDRVRVENNPTLGIDVNGQSTTGAVTGVIRDSVISGSAHSGIVAVSANSPVTVSLDHTHVANNVTGIVSSTNSVVILNNSTVQENNTGLSAGGGGAIFSYGNNAINGNQPGGIGTTPIAIGFH
jgi:hypothetical protein